MPRKRRDSRTATAKRSSPRERARATRPERVDMRLTAKQKQLVEAAARARGETTSQFFLVAAIKRAKQVLRREELIRLTAEDRARLIEALANPPAPSARLRAAWKDYEDTFAGT